MRVDRAPGQDPRWARRRFLVCIHDATPFHAGATRTMIRDLAPLVGRRLSFGVVPDWHDEWPLAKHPGYCRLLQESSHELLLHGYSHRRGRGRGPVTLLARGCDEMNGLDPAETRRTLERGQQLFTDAFGEPARGFLAPGWQPGHVRAIDADALGLTHLLGFFSLEPTRGMSVPLSTYTWDCGRWAWLGHVGHGIGWMQRTIGRGVPTLALHPGDLESGFWPRILRLVRGLLESDHEPVTVEGLLPMSKC